MIIKLGGKEYDLGLETIFPKPGSKGPASKKLQDYREKRQQKRRIANASKRRNQ